MNLIKRFVSIFIIFLFVNGSGYPQEIMKEGKNIVIGKSYLLKSRVLNEERELLISLPTGYGKSKKAYPVFFLLDGGIQFHNISGIIEYLSKFKHIPEMILVAIKNTDRERDFLPFKIDNWPPDPSAHQFRKFIRTELIPVIDKTFRTTGYRILAGHSFGAIYCLDNFMKAPDMFTAFIAISPSLDWDKTGIKKMWTKVVGETTYKNKFIYIATSADDYEESVRPTKELVSILEEKNPPGLKWHFQFMPDDDHLTVVHPVIFNALRWFHKGWRIPERSLGTLTLQQVIDHHKKLSEWYGSEVPVHEGILFNMGYLLFDKGKKIEAIEVFKRGMKLYPDMPACYVGMGDLHRESGDKELALKYYKKALKLAEADKDPMIYPLILKILKEMKKKN